MKKIDVILLLCSMGVVVQAQTTVIDPLTGRNDPLTGGLVGYTSYLVNDVSAGAGEGVSFPASSSGLSAAYVGTGTTAEQALFLAPVNSFSTTFAVGDTLMVNTAIPSSSTVEDFGLAISANNPTAASSGNSYNSRTLFDWMSISVRPSGSGGTIRVNTSVSGTLTTASFALSPTSLLMGSILTGFQPMFSLLDTSIPAVLPFQTRRLLLPEVAPLEVILAFMAI